MKLTLTLQDSSVSRFSFPYYYISLPTVSLYESGSILIYNTVLCQHLPIFISMISTKSRNSGFYFEKIGKEDSGSVLLKNMNIFCLKILP